MTQPDDAAPAAWQQEKTVEWFLDSVRGAIPFAREQFAVALQIVENGRQPVRRFLDLGAGDGVLSAVFLARYPAAEPVLVDFSPPMLAAAKERLASLASQPAFLEADLATLTWRDSVAKYAPFDAIVSSFAIHHLEDERKRALYGELLDLLAPGGTFAHIEHVAADTPWMARAFDAAMIDAIWEYGRRSDPGLTHDAAATAYANRLDRDANRLAPLDTQCAWLRDAGYTQVPRHSAGTRSRSSAATAPPDITLFCYTSGSTPARANGARAVSCVTGRVTEAGDAGVAPTDQHLLTHRLTD